MRYFYSKKLQKQPSAGGSTPDPLWRLDASPPDLQWPPAVDSRQKNHWEILVTPLPRTKVNRKRINLQIELFICRLL